MPRIRPLLANCALLAAVCALLTGAAEAGLRLSGEPAPGYVTRELYGNVNLLYRPNSRTRWRGNLGQPTEYDTPVTTNSIAQFDREHAVEKPDGVYRVIVAGDSFVEALQVPLENGFTRLLEAALNREPAAARGGRRIEVIKIGGSGNGALKTLEALNRHGWTYRPDLVLFFFTDSNDFNDDWHYLKRQTGQEIYEHVNLRPPVAAYDQAAFYARLVIFPGSHLNRWIAFRTTQWMEKKRRQKEDADRWKEALGAYALPGSPRFAGESQKWAEAFRVTAAGILKMKEAAEHHGARFAVVLNDRPQTYRPDAYRYWFRLMPGLDKEVDLDLPAKMLTMFLKSRGIVWLDLNPAFRPHAARRRTGHYRYDGHWNADGHRWTADALAPFVKGRMQG